MMIASHKYLTQSRSLKMGTHTFPCARGTHEQGPGDCERGDVLVAFGAGT